MIYWSILFGAVSVFSFWDWQYNGVEISQINFYVFLVFSVVTFIAGIAMIDRRDHERG